MIEFGGNIYYIDISAIENIVKPSGLDPSDLITDTETKTILDSTDIKTSTEIIQVTRERGREMDAAKYDIVRLMLDVLMDGNNENEDDSLGLDRALDKTSLPFKIAFNSLIKYGILKEVED